MLPLSRPRSFPWDRHKSEAANMARLAAVDKRIADIGKRLAAEFPDYERTHRVTEANGATQGKWNAKRSEGTQTLPQAARCKIQEDTHLRGEFATSGVK